MFLSIFVMFYLYNKICSLFAFMTSVQVMYESKIVKYL